MNKNRSNNDDAEIFDDSYREGTKLLPIDISENAPILRSQHEEYRFLTKRCLLVTLLVVTIAAVLIVFGFTDIVNWSFDGKITDPTQDADDPEQAPPPSSMPVGIYEQVGVVSNGGPCAQIGVNVMKKGGNAVDAAIATMVCDGALCPEYMGIGGGFIMSIYNATTKNVTSVNARETAPAAANSSMFIKDPKKSVYGGLSVAVPGSLKGYSTLYNLYGGGVPWEALFEETIQLCEEGMVISEHLEMRMLSVERLLKKDPNLRKTFFNKTTGRVKKAGEIYTLPKLAETMKIIAKEGADAFYNGSLTSKLLKDIKQMNGIITKEDLVNYEVDIEESFAIKLKNGYTLHSGPPSGSGIILAYILRILDGMLPAPNAGLDAQRIVEAFKYGYAERTHLGDHKFVNVSEIFDKVNSDIHIDSIQNKISDNFTSLDPKYYGADFDTTESHGTANIVVTDSLGNAVVGTNTINTLFGCGFMSPNTGIILNNEMDDFSTPGLVNAFGLSPSPANFIEPGKRPMSSMCPSIFTDENGDFSLGIGAAGGSRITLATAYISAYKLWFDYTLKEAVDKPRIYHQLLPMEVLYEYGTTKDVVQKLKDIGHPITRLKNAGVSGATAIFKSPSGTIEAMADFRRPGNSSGY